METTYNLYNGITNYVHYLSTLLGDSKANSKRIIESDNITYSKIALFQNFFLLTKSEVINKKGNNAYISKVIDECLIELVDVLFEKKKNGYLVCGEILRKSEAILFLRNKIANGEFYVDLKNDAFILKTLPSETVLSLKKLNAVLIGIAKSLVTNKNLNRIDKVIVLSNYNVVRNDDELKKALKGIVIKEYTLESNNKQIEKQEIDEFNNLIKVINEYFKSGFSSNDIIESYKKVIDKKGLKLKESTIRLSTSEIRFISELLLNDNVFYNVMNSSFQKKRINEILMAIRLPEYGSEGLMMGTFKNLLILNGNDNSGSINSDAFLAALATEFLTLYRPLLSEEFVNFNFSKLKLSNFKPAKLTNYDNTLSKKIDELDNYKRSFALSLQEYKNLEESYYGVTSKEKREYLMLKLILKEKEIKELYDIVENLEDEINILFETNPEHINNKNIIEGIINSIMYGNTSIRKNLNGSGNIRDYVIDFSTLDKEFKLSLRVEDFLELFRECNVEIINKHFNKIEKQKKKVRK